MNVTNYTTTVPDPVWFSNSSNITDTPNLSNISMITKPSIITTFTNPSNITDTFANPSNISMFTKPSNITSALNNSLDTIRTFRRSNVPDAGVKTRLVFTSSIILAIWISSTPPAAAIWRNDHLHRASYFYVMVLCLLDCFLGCSIGAMVVTISINHGIPDALCVVFEVLTNGTLHAISAMMLALSRDRFRSLQDPISYRAAVRRSVVWRHLTLALLYGLTQGGGIWVGIRWYFGGGLMLNTPLCDTFDWLLDPRNRPVAIIGIGGNIVVDVGTIVYNARIMRCAWRAKKEVVERATQRNVTEEAQRRRNMKMVIFTFKLACLFLGCSMPYKVALLLHGLGLDIPRLVMELLGLIRILYHIVDGWIVCTNEELLEAMKLMFCPCGSGL